MMKIPLVDLRAQYREIGDEIEPVMKEVMAAGRFSPGAELERFEREFAAYCGGNHAVGVASGLDALRLSLEALGVGEGDEVIVPVNTFIATALAVSHAGAQPVLVDVDERTFNIDIDAVKAAFTDRTRAIIPVHLYGQPVDSEPVVELAEKKGVFIIEDACQAHGAEYKGKRVGGLGHAGCFSFYPGKNLGAYGDGGMVVTNNEKLAGKLRMLRDVGRAGKHRHVLKGYNSRLDNLQSAILMVKLRHLDHWTELRRKWAACYHKLLAGSPSICPQEIPDVRHVYHLYVIRTEKREALLDHLHRHGIGAGIHYPVPLHLQEAYADLGYKKGDFPVAERLAMEILSLPMYPEMGEDKVREVVESIIRFYR